MACFWPRPVTLLHVQVVMQVAPAAALAQLHEAALKDHLLQLANHPVANFVVQAYIAAVKTTPQVGPHVTGTTSARSMPDTYLRGCSSLAGN